MCTKSKRFNLYKVVLKHLYIGVVIVTFLLTSAMAHSSPVYDGTNPPPLPGTVGDYYSYTLGTYLSGGTASGYNPSPPSDYYSMPSPLGIAGAANDLDWHWIQGCPVYDLGFSSNMVFVFPTGDHPPYPQDNVEALVLGRNTSTDPWVAATLNNVYRDGWIDYNNDGAASMEADDYASEWIFSNAAYRYIMLDQTQFGPDNDMETDAIGAPVPEPSTILLLLFGLVGMVGIKKKFS